MSVRTSLRVTTALTTLPLAVFVAVRVLLAQGTPAVPALTVLSSDARRALPLSLVGAQEFVALDDLAAMFQLAVREESAGAITVSFKGKMAILTPEQPLASVGGRLVSLPAPLMRIGRRRVVPVDFVGRVLPLLLDVRLDFRKPSRLLILGDLRVPRVVVRYEATGALERLTFDASPKTSSKVSQQGEQLVVRFDADAIDAIIPPLPSTASAALVRGVRLTEAAALTIDLAPRFGSFRIADVPSDTSSRFAIDVGVPQAPMTSAGGAPVGPAPPPPVIAGTSAPGLRVIVIDPGHGGDDAGASGARGTKEKDVALAAARRLKNAIEARLGVRVILTREDDRAMPVDSRAAIANNSKADLFISLHANASPRKETVGATIWQAEFGAEALRAAAAAAAGTERLPVVGGGQRDIELVHWDVAQVRQMERSSEFARLVAQQLDGHVPLAARSLERAPLRVLESANMPAVLLEMGYLSNAGQEARLGNPDFQGRVAQAVLDAIVKYRDGLDDRRRPAAVGSPPAADIATAPKKQDGLP